VLQLASEARERKKKFSGSVEVLRFERTLELARRQLRKTDNIALNDARLQSALTTMYQEAKQNGLRSTWGHRVEVHEVHDPAVTSANGVPSVFRQSFPPLISADPAEKCDIGDSGSVALFVAMTTASVTTVATSSQICKVTTSATKITPPTATTTTAASSAVPEVVTASLPLDTISTVSVANGEVRKPASGKILPVQPSTLAVMLSTATSDRQTLAQSSSFFAVTTSQSIASSVSSSAKLADDTTPKPVNSANAVPVTVAKSADSVGVPASAAAGKSASSTTSAFASSLDGITVAVSRISNCATQLVDTGRAMSSSSVAADSLKALPVSSPIPLSDSKSLVPTPPSPSPSPKGHVTFSDHVTEIQPSTGGPNGKLRRLPPAPPPRKAIKNTSTEVCPSSPNRPRDRPYSAVEPLAATGLPNGIGRTRPLSMAPIATVDSDSDSSVGTESQTGTIRRNTDKRNGGRGLTPPPVPTRKTSSLSSKSSEGLLVQDAQYCNLTDVRRECARLELAAGQLDGRVSGSKVDGTAKCEETEIY